ncbi:putative Helper component proteinase [Prochlorococcus marinus str. SB]|uniref:Putative Helper component proteinase n=1 Tax=Prochlorococcus marinus str. SB TaxID=59926 RepID=A0A0A2B6I3_PROMR|nr:putative Helper component proteinase [Prochlorococcus marinus str. SB]
MPTSIFIFRGSLPLVSYINNWIEKKINNFDDSEVIDTDSVPLDD